MKKNNIISFMLTLLLMLTPFISKSNNTKNPDGNIVLQMEKIRAKDVRNFGNIIEKNVLVGYYYFTKGEKTGNGNAEFEIKIYDVDFKYLRSIEIESGKNSQLIEMNYNGNAFMVMMAGRKGVDLFTFSKDGKQLGEIKEIEVSKFESFQISAAMNSDEPISSSINSLGDYGFVRQVMVSNKKMGYVLEGYNNKLELMWTSASDTKASELESADVLYSSSKFIGVLKSTKKNQLTRDVTNSFFFLDAESGNTLFELDVDKMQDITIHGCYVDDANKLVYLNGEYYAKGKNSTNNKSEGLYLMKLDIDGNVVQNEQLTWKKDLINLTATSDGSQTKENMRFYIHKVQIGKDGNTYVVAEQYKMILSASAVGMKLLNAAAGGGSTGMSSFSIKIYNMVYMVFNKDFKLVQKEVVKKKFSEVYLPASYEYASTTMIAHYLKAAGLFDYQYSTINEDGNGFTSYYIDINRKGEDGKKNDAVVGSITLGDGDPKTNRTPIDVNSRNISIHPAKKNHLMVLEYYALKKKLTVRLEPLNY